VTGTYQGVVGRGLQTFDTKIRLLQFGGQGGTVEDGETKGRRKGIIIGEESSGPVSNQTMRLNY